MLVKKVMVARFYCKMVFGSGSTLAPIFQPWTMDEHRAFHTLTLKAPSNLSVLFASTIGRGPRQVIYVVNCGGDDLHHDDICSVHGSSGTILNHVTSLTSISGA